MQHPSESSDPIGAADQTDQTGPTGTTGPTGGPVDPAQRQERNSRLLRQLDRSTDQGQRLRLRNALVTANLPLARSIAARLQPPRRDDFEDRVQVASLGLIRAVEAFDPGRNVRLSSFAVPYVRGALLHDQRDRQAAVRIPRALWELRQQAARLQEERRGRGLPPLERRNLARQLGCSLEQLDEIASLPAATHPRSLDAPAGPSGEDGPGLTLLERLADPHSLLSLDDDHDGGFGDGDALSEEGEGGPEAAMLHWLTMQLAGLDALRRALLLGRLLERCTWVELGRRHGIHPRTAQRRCDASLLQLRRAAADWQTLQQLRPAATAT